MYFAHTNPPNDVVCEDINNGGSGKQYLHLSSCSSNTFDAQIAYVSLVLMRYIVLTYCKILNYQLSFGGLLSALSRERFVLDLVSRLILILGSYNEKNV
jgi:hypothetical protein